MDLWLRLLCAAAALGIVLLLAFVVYLLRMAGVMARAREATRVADANHTFVDENGVVQRFPSLADAPSKSLTLLVPAYNEEERLTKMIEETIKYVDALQLPNGYEIIVADDGSADKTYELAQSYVGRVQGGSECLRVLRLLPNRGKGGAVREAAMCARGERLLMVDADGATEISDLAKLQRRMDAIVQPQTTPLGIVVGSRAAEGDEDNVQRSLLRRILQKGFHLLVVIVVGTHIKDTQCGFKLFTRAAATAVFTPLHIERWAFDLELIYLAKRLNVAVAEEGVTWTEIDGSHLDMWAPLTMARDMMLMRMCYVFGIWKVADKPKQG